MAMNAPAQAGPQPRLPFGLFTRVIPEFLGNFVLTLGGSPVRVELDRVGYGEMVILHVRGTYTVATATLVFRAGAPWNILSRIFVKPPGLAAPISDSGVMRHLWNLVEAQFAPFVKGSTPEAAEGLDANSHAAGLINVFPTAVGAATAHLWYVLPFHRSSIDLRGILPLGTKTARTVMELSVAAAADLFTTPANFTVPVFSVDVYQHYLPSPPPGIGADPDPYWAVTYETVDQAIGSLGDQVINLEPNDTITGLLHLIVMNDLPNSADINDLTLRVNKSYYIEGLDADDWFFTEYVRLGRHLPVGVIFYDLDRFVDSAHDGREQLNSQDVTAIQSVIGIPAGTLGTVARIFTGIRRVEDLNATAT